MADEIQGAGATGPAGGEQKQEQAQADKPRVQASDLPGEALTERLDRERRKAAQEARDAYLKELGVESADEVKSALKELKAKREAEKTAAEKLAELQRKYESTHERSTLAEAVVAERYELEVSKLTEPQKAAVAKLAGDDKVKALRAIDTLSATWVQAPEKKQEEAKGAPEGAAPPRNAPKEGSHSPPDRKSEFEALLKTNPFQANAFLAKYRNEIFPSP